MYVGEVGETSRRQNDTRSVTDIRPKLKTTRTTTVPSVPVQFVP